MICKIGIMTNKCEVKRKIFQIKFKRRKNEKIYNNKK